MYDNIGGNKARDVSLSDILSLVRPKPENKSRSALYAWLNGAKIKEGKLVQDLPPIVKIGMSEPKIISRTYEVSDLPERVRAWEDYKVNPANHELPPKVPYQMLEGLSHLTVAD